MFIIQQILVECIYLIISSNQKMKVLISGAGIGGLTLGLTAKKAGLNPIIVQKRPQLNSFTFGGGIGLWPPSQQVMKRLGVLGKLEAVGAYMPDPYYLNSAGKHLAEPGSSFSTRFPVLCLQRNQLTRILIQECRELGVEIAPNLSVVDAHSKSKGSVTVLLSDGRQTDCRSLIGADGINSTVRSIIMKELNHPDIHPTHCGYAYFRTVLDVGSDQVWHESAFQSWGDRRRFGYVPLKAPKTFWFVAIPLGVDGLKQLVGSAACTQENKQWILKQFGEWKGPINIRKLIEMTPAETILRTDIRKVDKVTKFPWSSKNSDMILLGDAANATAPNLAQGAGLAIESAWDLVSMVDLGTGEGVQQYVQQRRKRAKTVQDIADFIAKTGQLPKNYSSLRDFIMSQTTEHLPNLQQNIFQKAVRHSLGGSMSKLHWEPKLNYKIEYKSIRNSQSLLQKIIGPKQFAALPELTQRFRQRIIGSGKGEVTLKIFPLMAVFNRPPSYSNSPFGAYVQTIVDQEGKFSQQWTRVFGEGEPRAGKYTTTHRYTPFSKAKATGLALTESFAKESDWIRFGYVPEIKGKQIHYKSAGVWVKGFKIPLFSFLLPTSQWVETQTEDGWEFDGKISMPAALGGFRFMHYFGTFRPDTNYLPRKNKKVVIAGGSGMVGLETCKSFFKDGWDVTVLSRGKTKHFNLPYVQIQAWDPNRYEEEEQFSRIKSVVENADAVVNLSGENPGVSRWNEQVKDKILKSRIQSLMALSSVLKTCKKQATFLQASAAGIYGDRGSDILDDNSSPGTTDTFRVNTCKVLEETVLRNNSFAIVMRIGHILSSKGGLYPFMKIASKLRASRFGRGGQYIPWVHIEDVAESILHLANNSKLYAGKSINIASPESHTYEQMLAMMAESRGVRNGLKIPIPESAMKLAIGEMSSVILESQRMYPQQLISTGYKFVHPSLLQALNTKQTL